MPNEDNVERAREVLCIRRQDAARVLARIVVRQYVELVQRSYGRVTVGNDYLEELLTTVFQGLMGVNNGND